MFGLYGPPDALTSLGVAGVWMTLGNSYAVCDIGFELSFAAVLGTLAGAELARKGRRFPLLRNSVWETLCVSACASAATFPVLVLWGLSASLYALVSSVAVLWLMEPILQLGLATALLGCWPALAPLHRVCSLCAATLAGCLNRWALWVSGWPGAQIYFDTACAALVCLLLLGLGWLAYHWRVRPRVALPCLVLTAALGHRFGERPEPGDRPGGAGREPERSGRGHHAGRERRGALPGRQQYPAAVETLLTRRGAREVEMLVDLRMNPRTPCTLEARERMAADEMPRYTTRRAHSSPAELEVLRVQNGCIVRITAAGQGVCCPEREQSRWQSLSGLTGCWQARPARTRCGTPTADTEQCVPLDGGKRGNRDRFLPGAPPRRRGAAFVSAFQSGRNMIK